MSWTSTEGPCPSVYAEDDLLARDLVDDIEPDPIQRQRLVGNVPVRRCRTPRPLDERRQRREHGLTLLVPCELATGLWGEHLFMLLCYRLTRFIEQYVVDDWHGLKSRRFVDGFGFEMVQVCLTFDLGPSA